MFHTLLHHWVPSIFRQCSLQALNLTAFPSCSSQNQYLAAEKKRAGVKQHQHQSKNCEETPGLVAQAKGLTQTWLMQKQNALKASST
jgi:hypothetical protein